LTNTESVETGRRTKLLLAAGCYLLFVIYGSLVPLDVTPRAFDLAWKDFLATPYLELGVEGRADWVANILLYMPLAYLLSAGFASRATSASGRAMRVVVIFAACAAVAFVVEFTQLFFPPRTVSINDIVAECIGSALGIGIWIARGGALDRLWSEMERGGPQAIRAAVVVYVLAYLTLSLFPYDFLISVQELSQKLAASSWGLIISASTCGRFSTCVIKLSAETAAVVPLGVLLGMVLGKRARHAYLISAVCGLALGFVTEVAQLFIASGISEGVSLLTRAVGMTLGVAVHRHLHLKRLTEMRQSIVPVLWVTIPVYVVALMVANGWFSAGRVGAEQVTAGVRNLQWLPFYYHYFTTETEALKSLLGCTGMYLPVGFAYWMWTARASQRHALGTTAVPALIAALLAVAMETGKLFFSQKHPDPTNVLIAAVAAALAYRFAVQFHRWALQGEPVPAQVRSRATPTIRAGPPGTARVLLAMALLVSVGIAVWHYPLGGIWPAVTLMAYGAVLWRHPGIWLPATLALLPLLNLSPWTGWIQINEFDLLVAVTLAVRLLQPRDESAAPLLSRSGKVAIAVLALSFCTSAAIGLFPLSPVDPNALTTYMTGYGSLRQFKGFAWALALLPLLIEETRNVDRFETRLVSGMLAGLCAVAAVALWERMVFAGLLDFAGEYRVEGPFPELHTGGGDVHAYLTMATPFAVAWMAMRPTRLRIAAGTLLFAVASYVLAVTFTRGGYVGYFGALGVLSAAAAIRASRSRTGRLRAVAIAVVLPAVGVAVMVPILSGSFMEARVAGAQSEAATRTGHWARAIDMRDRGAATAVFGMGLGSFPRTFLFNNPDAASATFSYEREGDNTFVRLGSGRPLYLGQRVDIAPGMPYKLALDARGTAAKAAVGVSLCEKSAQYSFRCREMSFPLNAPGGNWEHHEAMMTTEDIGSGPWFVRRPVFLSLANTQRTGLVDVDNVHLTDMDGRDLMSNGDFSKAGARWFFSADDHLPWHIFNVWIGILFEQGWIGVVACAFAIAMALTRVGMGTWQGDWFSATLLASLSGFLLIGFTESLFDGPRVTTLFFLLLFVALIRPHAADSAQTSFAQRRLERAAAP